MASKLLPLRRLTRLLKPRHLSSPQSSTSVLPLEVYRTFHRCTTPYFSVSPRRSFSSVDANSEGPAAIDYRSLLQEDEFHRLANATIHDLQEKLEEYGDTVQIDGFDVDYGNEVLTVKLGELGTYVLNKQTPNRQLWLSSPVSGPSRFDWDQNAQTWIYRRTKANLLELLETELQKLCGEPITLA